MDKSDRLLKNAEAMPTVAELLISGLVRAGVPRVFGVPGGGSNLELLEAARGQGLPFVLCHQEWAACIMAAVTGELTGHPGAVLSTLGPGVTASATGLAHARLDRSPLIYISDRHPAGVLEYATHQYLDHTAHLGPITKGSVTVGVDSAAHWVAHAVQLALEEPLVKRADLIIAFGLDTVELIPRRWAYTAPVLSLTRCAADDPRLRAPGGDAYFTPALEVVGEPGAILEDLASRIMGPGARADWDVAEGDRIRRERLAALEVPVPGLAPHRVAQMTRELTAAGSIATVDAGAHMFQATTYWHALEPGELLISNGLATMGFALPAAIAAQLVHPDRRVICFTGDGGLMMVASELETVARLRLPIVIVVFNDAALSPIEVKQEQKGFEGGSMPYAGPDLIALGRAFGIRALAATHEPTLHGALIAAQTAPGPTLIDARIDPSGYRKMLEIVRGAPK